MLPKGIRSLRLSPLGACGYLQRALRIREKFHAPGQKLSKKLELLLSRIVMELITALLKKAVQGETDAEERYRVFSRQAENEGCPKVATLFLGLSHAEAIHISNHKKALEKNGYTGSLPSPVPVSTFNSTLDNVRQSLEGEKEEFSTMYPSFRKQIAKKHGKEFLAKIALLSIKWALESEKNHHALLAIAENNLQMGKDMEVDDLYLCTVCGNLEYFKTLPEEMCTICGHDPMFFSEVSVLP